MKRAATLLAVCLMVSGCTSFQHSPSLTAVALGQTAQLELSAPPQQYWGRSETRLLEGHFDGQRRQLVVQSEFSKQQIALAALLPSGVPVMEIVWHAAQPMQSSTHFAVENLQPSFIIADLQLALWPVAQLQQHLKGDVDLYERPAGAQAPRMRQLDIAGQPAITITYYPGYILISHLHKGYEIRLSPLE